MKESDMKDPVLPISFATEGSAGITGNWRTSEPKLNLEKCNKCGRCWISCPEAAISYNSDGFPKINYGYCKGCLVCVYECPTGALTEIDV